MNDNKLSKNTESKENAELPSNTPHHKPYQKTRNYNRRRGDISSGAPPWLLSFTDIMALMLTFFVLLYAMSEPEKKSWNEVMAALQKEFHVFNGPRQDAGPKDIINLERVNFNLALPLNYLDSLLERVMQDSDGTTQMTFQKLEGNLIISLPEEVLFASGTTDIQEGTARELYRLGTALSKIRNRIEIIGHSDPGPITNPNSEFASNWELSLERASVVASILKRRGYIQPITIKGYSSARYNDISAQTSEQVKEKFSRRVDIQIMPDDGQRTLEQRYNLEISP